MLRIDCPVCGPRNHDEFTYGGNAAVRRPPLDETRAEPFHDYVFIRENPAGPTLEFWHHVLGCRQWLVVERDTVSHAVASVRLAREVRA